MESFPADDDERLLLIKKVPFDLRTGKYDIKKSKPTKTKKILRICFLEEYLKLIQLIKSREHVDIHKAYTVYVLVHIQLYRLQSKTKTIILE